MLRVLYFALVRDCFLVFDEHTILCNKKTYLCNKKLTDLDCLGCMGKYPTSVLLYSSNYSAIVWSIQQDLERFDIFHKALTLSK